MTVDVRRLISPAYLDLQRQLHASPRGYGECGDKWAGAVLEVVDRYGCSSVLDYGCGQGSLGRALRAAHRPGLRVDEYDPAIDGKSAPPSFADLVVSTDVLEHIEPDCLEDVLAHLHFLARKVLLVVISTRSAQKVLADGRNAHLIVRPDDWWADQLRRAGFAIHPAPASARKKPAKEWTAVLTHA